MTPTTEREFSRQLIEALVQGNGMNDFLYRFLQSIGGLFGVPNLVLYDYDEPTGAFDLLYFSGFPDDARSELRRRLYTLDIGRSLSEREPYFLDPEKSRLVIPLYFQEVLEAALVLESPDHPVSIEGDRRAALQLISRFLGLFMSSSRLPVNQQTRTLDMTDLQRARDVQKTYLPTEYPVTDRYEIFGYNHSSALVGGDYFDYFRQRDKSIQCVVADACGHGLAAALIMSTFRGFLHSEVRRTEEFSSLFNRLNSQLYSGGEILQYLTGVFFRYDEDERTLRHFNAGHFEPIVVHTDGRVTRLAGGGPPLGMFRGSRYETCASPMQPGDILVLFTDGLVELRNTNDDFFGVDGIERAVVENRSRPLNALAMGVLETAASFNRKQQPEDDLTLFLMRFR